jgi:hypothetical protein
MIGVCLVSEKERMRPSKPQEICNIFALFKSLDPFQELQKVSGQTPLDLFPVLPSKYCWA